MVLDIKTKSKNTFREDFNYLESYQFSSKDSLFIKEDFEPAIEIVYTPETVIIAGKRFVFKQELDHIANKLKSIESFIDKNELFSEDDFVFPEKELLLSATNFLFSYSLKLLDIYNIILESPDVNPCVDGSIDLSWRTNNARMLINLKKSTDNIIYAYYYGDLFNNKLPIKGNVTTDKIFDHLLYWMKYLRK